MGGGRARGDTLLVPDKGHEKGIGCGDSAHELRQPWRTPAQPLLPGAPRLACSLPPSAYLFCVSPHPLSGPPPPQPPLRPALRLHPTSLIIASFSQRQIVQPGDAPEDLRPLTNGLLIFYHKGRRRGARNQSHIYLHHRCRGTLFPG